jgi:hypothetical protein
VKARTGDGRALRLLTVIDESSRECMAIDVARRLAVLPARTLVPITRARASEPPD